MAVVLRKSKHSFEVCSVRFEHNTSASNSMRFTRIVLFSLGDIILKVL